MVRLHDALSMTVFSDHLATDLTPMLHFLKVDAETHRHAERESSRKQAENFAMMADGLEVIRRLLSELTSGPLPETLPPILRELIGSRNRQGEAGEWAEKVIETVAPKVMDGLAQLNAVRRAGVTSDTPDQLTLLVDLIGENHLERGSRTAGDRTARLAGIALGGRPPSDRGWTQPALRTHGHQDFNWCQTILTRASRRNRLIDSR